MSARAVPKNGGDAPGSVAFNLKAESPSIRKTPGIDHSKSIPVGRNGQHVPGTPSQPDGEGKSPASVRPVVTPQLDGTRRIGAPGGVGPPNGNRGQFRPLSVKRPAPEGAAGRQPLVEVPGSGNVVSAAGKMDAKRVKTE
jgi:DNA repair and recombination protein RAD52